MLKKLRSDLEKLKNPQKAVVYTRFFKTGKGDYGEGDIFLGISVPDSRKIAVQYENLPFTDITKLLKSKIHEERLIALLLLVHNFEKSDEKKKKEIYKFYLKSTKYINNWDLVDLSAPKIVGEYLLRHSGLLALSSIEGSRIKDMKDSGVIHQRRIPQNDILVKLTTSGNLWERRIAIIATYQFIWKAKNYKDTFRIAEILLDDKHDLIQKAVGWMIREVGKRISRDVEEKFLQEHYHEMGRIALRYAIERFPENLRKKYLKGEV